VCDFVFDIKGGHGIRVLGNSVLRTIFAVKKEAIIGRSTILTYEVGLVSF
jgi:hypothetical protein